MHYPFWPPELVACWQQDSDQAHRQNGIIEHPGSKTVTLVSLFLVIIICSIPSLSGHSQQRPPSLMWPNIFVAANMNEFTSHSQ